MGYLGILIRWLCEGKTSRRLLRRILPSPFLVMPWSSLQGGAYCDNRGKCNVCVCVCVCEVYRQMVNCQLWLCWGEIGDEENLTVCHIHLRMVCMNMFC